MTYPESTRQWVLASHPTDKPVVSGSGEQTFKLESKPLPSLRENQALVRALYFANDPAQRTFITKDIKRLYRKPVKVDDVMAAGAIGEVVESSSESLKPGMLVSTHLGWTEFRVTDAEGVTPLPGLPPGIDVSHYLGSLGTSGFTAYYGLTVIAEAKPEDVVVVSVAAGATGSMAVQIAKKIIRCKRVIGIAGGEKKCRWVEEHLGADVCVDYKSPSFEEDLVKATGGESPDVNVYFDNVGGEILDLMLTRLAMFGRIAACGAVSNYNESSDKVIGFKNWIEVISMRLQIRGFITLDYLQQGKRGEALNYLLKGFEEGKLKIGEENQHVVSTKFEDVPKVWMKLFEGSNTGKLITKLDE